MQRTVVVLRALGLGDTVTGLPALHLLRHALPEHRVVLAAPHQWAQLAVRVGVVDDVVDAHELAPLSGAPQNPQLAIDLHGNGPASRSLLEPLHPERIISYTDGAAAWRHSEHEVQRWCRLLSEGLPAPNASAPGIGGVLGEPPAAGMPTSRTVIHCGAASASRRWFPERFAAAATLLAAEGHDVVITAGPGEENEAARIATCARVPAVIGMSVDELLDLVGNARLIICGDTGVAHLASAYEVPSVTLCGPVSPVRWGPPDHPRHQVLWHGDDTGDPHGTTVDPALQRITVTEVVRAAHHALADEVVPR